MLIFYASADVDSREADRVNLKHKYGRQVVVAALAGGVGALGARARAGGGRVARRRAGRRVRARNRARAARLRPGARALHILLHTHVTPKE